MEYSIYLVGEEASGREFPINPESDARAPRLNFTRQNRTFEFARETTESLLEAIPASEQTSPLAIALKKYLSSGSSDYSLDLRSLSELDELWKS